jgi:hypothetical protein
MNVIRKTQKISSTSLKIEELREYIGTVVDIMILPHPPESLGDKKDIISYAGAVPSLSDPMQAQKKLRDEWSSRFEPAS